MKTPMFSDTKLTKDEECESVDSTKYRGMIGSLLYLMASRPDIMFSVRLYARFQEDPKTSYLEAVKRIFRYIKGTTYLGLWYPKGTGIETIVYADSNHAGDYVDLKSTSEFAQILDIPCEGACVFTDKWSLDELAYGVPTDEGQVRRIRHEQEIYVHDHQILIREIVPTLKPLEEIIWENVFCLGGNRDHVPACLCYMSIVLQTLKSSISPTTWRIEWNSESPELLNQSYVLYDRVMNPLTAQQERKTRKDRGTRRGRHSTSFSSAFDQPSSSHLNDDDDGNDEVDYSILDLAKPSAFS
ncbi:hypothetical protein Tco_1207215 [Tanacetum coccineum]